MNLAWGEGEFIMRYTRNQEGLINKLVKEKVNELQSLLHDKKSLLSDRQCESLRRELRECQELLYQNRLYRHLKVR